MAKLTEKYSIHISNKKDYSPVLKRLDNMGIEWFGDGSSPLNEKVSWHPDLHLFVDRDKLTYASSTRFSSPMSSAEFLGINCNCEDNSCKNKGQEGEVEGHIENCSCDKCHREMGKL